MSNIVQRIKALANAARSTHAYRLERAILRFTEMLSLRMKAVGVGPTVLAEKIGAKPPYISKIMRGKSNFTLDSMIKLCSALDADFVFAVVPKNKGPHWISFKTPMIKISTNMILGGPSMRPVPSHDMMNLRGSNAPMVKIPSYELS